MAETEGNNVFGHLYVIGTVSATYLNYQIGAVKCELTFGMCLIWCFLNETSFTGYGCSNLYYLSLFTTYSWTIGLKNSSPQSEYFYIIMQKEGNLQLNQTR